MSMNSGAMFQWPRQSRRARPTELRELVSSAKRLGHFDGLFGNDQEAADFVLGGDRHPRQRDHAFHALIFDGGDDGDVGAPGAQLLGALRGHGERKVVAARERPVREAPDQRRGVQEFDDGDAQFAHIRCCPGTNDYSIARAASRTLAKRVPRAHRFAPKKS